MRSRFTFISAALLIGNIALGQAGFLPLRQDLQTTLDSLVAAEGLPGATLAAVLPDGRLISLAAGYEDVELKKPMGPGSRMFTGSTGKTFVSAVALQLAAEGKIDLNGKVADWFRGQEDAWYHRLPNAADLTVRSLMNHTSGLPRYIFQDAFQAALKADPMRSWTPQECLAVLAGVEPTHAVGKGWGYSDTNYILLGLIIEKATGDTFYHQAQQRILEPFQLGNTIPSTQRALPGLAQGYIGDDNFLNLPKKTVENGLYAMNPQFEWCGGGFVTNTEDMAHWMKWLHDGKVLTPEVYHQLIQPVDFRTGQPAAAGYGLGAFVWQTPLGKFLGHAGVMPGYLTQVEYSDRYGFSIALQTNTDQGMGRRHHAHVQRFAGLVAAYLDGIYAADEQAIRDNFRQQENCWNQGDIDCYMTAYLKSDSIRTISSSGFTYGYENIRQHYFKYFPAGKMGQLHFDKMNLTRLSDAAYYVVGRFNLEFPDREEPVQGHFSVLMQKVDGRWVMVSDHSG